MYYMFHLLPYFQLYFQILFANHEIIFSKTNSNPKITVFFNKIRIFFYIISKMSTLFRFCKEFFYNLYIFLLDFKDTLAKTEKILYNYNEL